MTVSDLPTSRNVPEFTVHEISMAIKRQLEGEFAHIRVRGELSGCKRASSGHIYVKLKDENAVIEGICWRGQAMRLGVQPEDGLEVIATGRLTTYPGRSQYQLIIEHLELAGEGALLKLLEQRRKKLAAEGLFDASRKKPLPFLPEVIGVITSPTGAVIRDILHRLADRIPRHVVIWPVMVQGSESAAQIVAAIEGFNSLTPKDEVKRPDLLIVARGGGSLEDLLPFSEEAVVRAAAASEIPLISAVGHETDITLIDLAADLRAPTPTAAAEMAVPVRNQLLLDLGAAIRAASLAASRILEERRLRTLSLTRALPAPQGVLMVKSQHLDVWVDRMMTAGQQQVRLRQERLTGVASRLRTPHQQLEAAQLALKHRLAFLRHAFIGSWQGSLHLLERTTQIFHTDALRHRLSLVQERYEHLDRHFDSLSIEAVLRRGFALVRRPSGEVITKAADAHTGERLEILLQDGHLAAEILPADDHTGLPSAVPSGPVSRRCPPSPPRKPVDPKQGGLF